MVVSINRFGRTLTDCEYGKSVAKIILQGDEFPLMLDFRGVMSLGSSYGDEIFDTIASNRNPPTSHKCKSNC